MHLIRNIFLRFCLKGLRFLNFLHFMGTLVGAHEDLASQKHVFLHFSMEGLRFLRFLHFLLTQHSDAKSFATC